MQNLDNLKQIEKMDPGQVGKSIELLPDQVRQVLEDSDLIIIPKQYSQINKVVIAGMGGSNIGAKIIKSALKDKIKHPLFINAGYDVPNFIDNKTLYILSSYSGTTEEPLSTYKEAKKRGAKIIAITSKGPKNTLEKLMIKDNIPGYIFDPRFNPCGQPRLGLGYSIFGIMVLLAKAGLFKIEKKEIKNIIANLELWTRKLCASEPVKLNKAKQIAKKFQNKIPTFVGAEFLIGNIAALRNQMSESSKQLPDYLLLPDLNHFAMEGLKFPALRKKISIFFFIESNLYHQRIQKRSLLTQQIVKKNGISSFSHTLQGKSKLEQAFELLQLGTWITYYLGMLNNVNPSEIPWVTWFKKELM